MNLFGSVGNFVDGVEYFSKKVFNDVIKLEVSTVVGIFFWKVLLPGQKSYTSV